MSLSLEGGETGVATFSRTVVAGDFSSDEIKGTITASYEMGGEQSVVVETSTVADKYDLCGIASVGGTATVTAGEPCIWKRGESGPTSWRVSVSPAEGMKQRSMTVTMRDHVPGNWCTRDGSGGGASGAEMPIGNLNSFYLWLLNDGVVTISQT